MEPPLGSGRHEAASGRCLDQTTVINQTDDQSLEISWAPRPDAVSRQLVQFT